MSKHETIIANSDYETVQAAIAYLSETLPDETDLPRFARALGLTERQLTDLFRRWCGLSPKSFAQAVALNHAKKLLADQQSVLDTTYEVGLSSTSRLHDLFVTHEAMSPGEWKTGGAGLTLRWGFHPCPFGSALLMATDRGLSCLAFADAGEEQAALNDMQTRWPNATYVHDEDGTTALARRVFDPSRWRPDQPLRVVLIGTDFEVRVWETLMRVPLGRVTTYSDLAARVCTTKAARAVGAAVGKNPLSFVVPCHRVLGKHGDLTGYHWGLTRKRAMLGWEAGQAGATV